MRNDNNVLILSFHYPPDIVANAFPTQSWVKYLPEYGWKPIVLTNRIDGLNRVEYRQNHFIYRVSHAQSFRKLVDLRSRIPNEKLSFKILNSLLLNFFLYPDEKRGWFKDAYKEGISIIAKHNIACILSTGAPWTDHWIASRLSKQTGIPWISDHRDPWAQKTTEGYRKKWIIQIAISRLLEKKILRTASCCVHASSVWAEQLASMLGKKVHAIPNGYDAEDFVNMSHYSPGKKRFTISYVGTLHFPQKLHTFLEGFKRFSLGHSISPKECTLNFVGTSKVSKIDKEYKVIRRYCNFVPYVSKPKAIKYMTLSHILLLFLNEDTGWYPTKVFEYLASGRQVLATPDNGGVINDLLKKTRGGVVLNSPKEVAFWLNKQFEIFKLKSELKNLTKMEAVKEFDRKRQTGKLAKILDMCK